MDRQLLNFNDLPCDIKRRIFKYSRKLQQEERDKNKEKCNNVIDEINAEFWGPNCNWFQPLHYKEVLDNISPFRWTIEDDMIMMENCPNYIPNPQDDWF